MASDDKKNADKIKASNSGGFRGWWNKQGKGTKALTALAGFCCFSLLVAMVIGFITPEHELTTVEEPKTESKPENTTPKVSENTTKTYSGKYFSFEYPANWKVTNDIGTTVEISPGKLGVSIVYFSDPNEYEYMKSLYYSTEEFKGVENIGGTECEVYYDSDDMAYIFWFVKNGKHFKLFSHEEYVDVTRNIIKTLK